MLVVLAPGQGAQSAGLLAPWLALPDARETVARWSVRTGLDLAALGTSASAEQVRDTAVAQPLLTAAALLSARAVLGDLVPDAVCGHSVGELPALAVAGVLDPDDAVLLAARRGAAMAAAAARRPTGMAALLGADLDTASRVAAASGLQVATVNAPGQVVLGGPVEALAALAAAPPQGLRVRALDVAGAFHTAAMAPATSALARALDPVAGRRARCGVVANADGEVLTDPRLLLARLVAQLTGPVRFDRCVDRLRELGVTAVVELAPGGTLAGIVKRSLPGVPVVAVRSPEDLPAARAMLEAVDAVDAVEAVDAGALR